MEIHKFPYNWKLAEANFTKDKGKVFSCFACGGGSTMGYKLAGFDVIGCNEIDPYFGNTSDEHITDDISQEGYVTSTGEDYPILKVNDLSDDNAMLEFAVIGLECDILKLSFLGRIKG